jgi:methionyl-tRNA formyltransferase
MIVTTEGEPEYSVDISDFEDLAADIDARFYSTLDLASEEVLTRFTETGCDVAVSVNWQRLIPADILDHFKYGVLNAHAGDLPRYRGNATPNWALINGEDEVVLTVHRMVPELDAGPILAQKSIPVDKRTTIGEIYDDLYELTPLLFAEVVDNLESGTVEATPQPTDDEEVLRTYPRTPKDSEIDWEQSATRIERIVRASSEPFFGAFTYFGTNKLRIWRARAEFPGFEYFGTPGQVAERRPGSGEVAVITGDGFLVLEEVQLEDGDRLSPNEVITSNRTQLGMDVTGTIRRLKSRIDELE